MLSIIEFIMRQNSMSVDLQPVLRLNRHKQIVGLSGFEGQHDIFFTNLLLPDDH